MDAPDNPTDPKEVELTEVDKKTPPEKKEPEQLIQKLVGEERLEKMVNFMYLVIPKNVIMMGGIVDIDTFN